MSMANHHDGVLSVGIMIATGAAVAAAMGWWTLIGFVLGVTTALAAAAIAGTDFY